MKDYLNGEERQQAMYFLITSAITAGVIMQNGKNMSKEEVRCLKFVKTYCEKFFEALGKRVGGKELMRIARESEGFTAVIKPRKLDGYYTVDKEALESIASMAVDAHCFGCEREDWDKCELYKYMKKLGVDRINEIPGKCTFFYEKEEE